MIRRLTPSVVLFCYAVLLVWLSLSPGTETEPLFPHDDKVFHSAAYFVFVVLSWPLMKSLYWVFALSFAIWCFSGLMELGQMFVPLRQPSIWDLLANTLGVVLAVWSRPYLIKLYPQKSPH